MKKWICALLSFMLILTSVSSLAAVSYTLPEKMQKQLDIGSGLKGSLTLHGEGNDPFILAMQPFQDVEIQFRGMKTGKEGLYYFYQAGENETQLGLTEIYETENHLFFRSDCLPDDVFQIPAIHEALDLLTQPEGGNPSLASAIFNWIEMSGEQQNALLDPIVEKFTSELEIWVAQFATVSEVKTLANGSSAIDLSYAIPMNEIKKEIVKLMTELIQSNEGQELFNHLLNAEQRNLIANANLDWFYLEALNAQDNDFDILYTRTVSTLGNQISSSLELPLDENQMKYQSLLIEESNGVLSLTLANEERLVTLIWGSGIDLDQIDALNAWIVIRPNPAAEDHANAEYHALRANISRSSSVSTDEEAREHERTGWKVTLERDVSRLPEGEDPDLYPEETPAELEVNLHYFSKYSQSSPTTLEIEAQLVKEDFHFSIQGQFKTASPWVFTPFDTAGAVDYLAMSEEQRAVKIAEFLAGASEQLVPAPENSDESAAIETIPPAESDGNAE